MHFRLGDTTDTTDTTGPGDTSTSQPSLLTQLITGFTQYKLANQQLKTADQITQLQLSRARAGLPPLNIDAGTLGVPSVSVGLSSGTQQLVLYGLLGIGGLFLLNTLLKRA